jgi:hypothetical protein
VVVSIGATQTGTAVPPPEVLDSGQADAVLQHRRFLPRSAKRHKPGNSKELEATAKAATEEDPVGLAAAAADEPWQGV